jgi:hypothetical protein
MSSEHIFCVYKIQLIESEQGKSFRAGGLMLIKLNETITICLRSEQCALKFGIEDCRVHRL